MPSAPRQAQQSPGGRGHMDSYPSAYPLPDSAEGLQGSGGRWQGPGVGSCFFTHNTGLVSLIR